MGLLDWFNPHEKDTTTFEVSNDSGEQIVFTVPTAGSNQIRKALRSAGVSRDKDEKGQMFKDFRQRDHDEYRWWAQRDIDEREDIEWQGDQEGGPAGNDEDDDTEGCDYAVDDEASEHPALRFWPKW